MERVKNKIIFDLDSTLVWCWFLDREEDKCNFEKIKKSKKYNSIKNDIFIYRLVDAKDADKKGVGSINMIAIFLRPNLRQFLQYVSENFEVDIWSAGEMRYVRMINHVLNSISENLRVTNIYSKRDCILTSKKVSKNISKKTYDLRKTIIIDDRRDVCEENCGNSIRIPEFLPKFDTFWEHFNECHLLTLMEWMKTNDLKNREDVRELDKRNIFS